MARTSILRLIVEADSARRAAGDIDRLKDGSRAAAGAVDKLGDESRETAAQQSRLAAAARDTAGVMRGLVSALVAVVGALGAREIVQAADDFRALQNRIRLVTDTSEEFATTQERLIAINQETFGTLAGTIQAFQRMASGAERLGVSLDEVIGVTKTVNQAIAISGSTAQASEAALIQFGQALSGDFKASAQELNSIIEQIPGLADAIAKGIQNVTGFETFRGDLKRLAEDGELSAELVVRALQSVGPEIDATFNDLSRTISQWMTRLGAGMRVLTGTALDPLIDSVNEVASAIAEALESPEAKAAAQNLGVTISNVARSISANIGTITMVAEGLAAALAAVGAVVIGAGVMAFLTFLTTPVGLAATIVGVVVAFRDELTRLLTPFETFTELARETGPVIVGAFDMGSDAASRLIRWIDELTAKWAAFAAGFSEMAVPEWMRGIADFQLPKWMQFDPLRIPREALDRLGAHGEVVIAERELALVQEAGRKQIEGIAAKFSIEIDEGPFKGALEWMKALGIEVSAANDNLKGAADETAPLKRGLELSKSEAEKLAKEVARAKKELQDAAAVRIVSHAEEFAGFGELSANVSEFPGSFETLRDRFTAISDAVWDAAERAFEDGIINQDGLEEVRETLDQAWNGFLDAADEGADRIHEAMTEGAEEAAQRLSGIMQGLFNDILFSGRGFEDIARDIGRSVANDVFIGPLSDALAGRGDIIGNVDKAVNGLSEGFSKVFASIDASLAGLGKTIGGLAGAAGSAFAGFNIGKAISDIIGIDGNPKSVAAGGAVGGAAGFVFGPIGAAIGATLGTVLGGLFSKPSGFGANEVINPVTGQSLGAAQRDNSAASNANAQVRNFVVDQVSAFTTELARLTGASIADDASTAFYENLLNIQVDNRAGISVGNQNIDGTLANIEKFANTEQGVEDAIRATIKRAVDAFSGGNDELVAFAQEALAAGRSVEDLTAILSVLSEAADAGVADIATYAREAAKAGVAAEDIATGVQALKAVFDLTIEPMSEVGAALKSIDDVTGPAIRALQSVGQSIAAISAVGDKAARAVGLDFIDKVQDEILRTQNSVLADYRLLLKEIEQRQKDATALLKRGAITQGEFESVEFLSAQKAQAFFRDLSEEQLESVGDFFGLLGDTAGQSVVKLTMLTDAIVDFTDEVVDTVERLQSEAYSIQSSVDRTREARDNILQRFSPFTPDVQLGDLRGQLSNILTQIQAPDASAEFIAAEVARAGDLGRQLVDLSASVFGATGAFAQDRDFATSVLDQIAEAGQGAVNDRLSMIDAANVQVNVLNDIRDQLANPDPSLEYLQAQLDEDRVTNSILRDLLAQYISAANSQAVAINPNAVQAASDAYLNAGGTSPAPGNSNAEIVEAIIRSEQASTARAQTAQSSLQRIVDLLEGNNGQLTELTDMARAA